MYSIVIATRDRPELLARALESVALQRFATYELLLVDDSSSVALRRRNAEAVRGLVPTGRIIETGAAEGGDGPGAARNRGIAAAKQPYLAFLDDDDEWTDPDYLGRAAHALERHALDLLFAEQAAVRADGSVVARPVWSEDLGDKLPTAGAVAQDGIFLPTVQQVLLSDGFAHLNTTIVRRSLAWDRLGGFDPNIRYEEDRDFYLRAIDAAAGIGYMPRIVARHHVPSARASASSIGAAQRETCRLAVLDKAVAGARHAAIRARCRRDRSFALRRMSEREAAAGQVAAAIRHGRAALRDRFSARSALSLAGLYLRIAVSSRSQAD